MSRWSSNDRDLRISDRDTLSPHSAIDLELAEDVIFVISEILSEIVAPGVFVVIDIYSEKLLGVSFIRAVEKNPKEAYKVLIKIFRNEAFLEIVEKAIIKKLRIRYRIRVPRGVLLSLKEGDNSAFMQMVSSIYDKLRTGGSTIGLP